MAILPVHQMIDRQPNYLASFNAGQQDAMRMQEARQAQSDNAALRGLAPQVVAGDPNAYAQAAAINPQAAGQYQQAGDAQLKRLRGFVTFVDQARATGNMAAVNAALREGAPFISRIIGKPGPTEWTPDMEPGWEALKARIAMADAGDKSEIPSGFRQFQMTAEAAGLKPGTPEYQQAANIALGREGRAATGGFGFELVEGPDGRKRVQRRNPRTGAVEMYDESTGDFVQIGSAAGGVPGATAAPTAAAPTGIPGSATNPLPQGAAQPAIEQIMASANEMMRRGMPEAQVDGWVRQQMNPGASAASPQGIPLAPQGGLGPRIDYVGGGLAVGRSPEEEAAAVEAAKQQAQLAYLPEQQRIETQGAIERARGMQQIESAAETASAAPGAIATLQNSVDSIDALLNSPNLDSVVGLGSMNPMNRIPGTAARGLIARADQVAGQAFLAAFNQLKGGGAITEREGAAATQAMARLDRSQSAEDYKQALRDLKSAIQPAIDRQRASLSQARQTMGASGSAQGAAVQRARNPQTGEILELRNGQWVPAR